MTKNDIWQLISWYVQIEQDGAVMADCLSVSTVPFEQDTELIDHAIGIITVGNHSTCEWYHPLIMKMQTVSEMLNMDCICT
jgi:hypothetical protein